MAEPPAPDPGSSPGEAEPAPAEAGADLVAVERYAAAYPERAASIRRTGRLPHDLYYFCPPEAALAGALITARTPALAALDGFLSSDANRVPDRLIAEARAA